MKLDLLTKLKLKTMAPNEERRTWNTPLRSPWNPVIKSCLTAIDQHVSLYLSTKDSRHLRQAQVLRDYVASLKDWLTSQEQSR